MNGSDFGNLLKSYPWDISRRINANPSVPPTCHVSGVSFDWEFLISSSFVDCKVLIQDWLVSRRPALRPEDDTFSDLQIPPIDADFKRRVLARTVLYEDHKFYDMIAIAYLYFVGIYEEETDLLAAFCAQKQALDLQTENSRTVVDGNGLTPIRFPDWATLATWLKECVEDVHRSAPAWSGGLARSSGVRQQAVVAIPNSVSEELAPGPIVTVGNKRQREEVEESGIRGEGDGDGDKDRERVVLDDEEGRQERHSRSEIEYLRLQHVHMQAQQQYRQLQHHQQQQHQLQQQMRSYSSGAHSSAVPTRPFLTTNGTAVYVNASQSGAAQQHLRPPPLALNQPFPSLYRQPQAIGSQFPQPLPLSSAGGPPAAASSATDVPAWLAPFSGIKDQQPRDGAFNYLLHPATSEEALHAAQFPNGRPSSRAPGSYNGHGHHAASVARNSNDRSSSGTMGVAPPRSSSARPAGAGKPVHGQGSPPLTALNGVVKEQLSVPYIGPVRDDGAFSKESLSLTGFVKSPQLIASAQLPTSTLVRSASMQQSQNKGQGQGLLGVSTASTAAASLSRNSASTGNITANGFLTNSAFTQQLMLQQKQQASQLASQQLSVNRRQKKNRDKFKVTFMVTPAKAAELKRTHGIVPDVALPAGGLSGVLGSSFSAPGSTAGADGALSTGSKAASKEKATEKEVAISVLLPLKGIDVLANGRYRVQLNTFMSGRKKFSRNSTDLYEALWIFEIALLISDSPPLMSELQRIGNYNCLAPLGHLGFFCSPREYYLELGRHILLFYDSVDFFSEELITIAIRNYDAMRPAISPLPSGTMTLEQKLRQKQSPASGVSAVSRALSPDGSSSPERADSDEEDDRLYNALLTAPSSASASAATGGAKTGNTVENNYNNKLSRLEEEVALPWMGGFAFGLCLHEQQLSCIFCLRGLPVPRHLPNISMLKEEKFTAAQIHELQQQQQQQQIVAVVPVGAGQAESGSKNGTAAGPSLSLLHPSQLT